MDVSTLQERKVSLENDMKVSKQTMSMLNEQLETAKAQFHVLSGHHHEVGYQIDCLIKETEEKKAAEGKVLKRA